MRIDGTVFKKTWKRIVKDSPFLTYVLFVKTFLTAVRPFVILHFSAEIINGLYRGTDVEEILFQAVWLSVSAMAIEMGCHLAGGYVEEAVRKSAYGQSQDMLEKAMRMNYQQMESSRVQSLVESIRQCEVQRGDVFTKEIQFFEKFYTGAFVVASSLFYVSQFAVEKLSRGGKSGQFISMLVCFVVLTVVAAAVTGRNGSGKTTCVKLMLRLYKPDSGKILLNGQDIWQYNEKEYWKRISVVFQDFKLFSVSLEQNLAGEGLVEQRLWRAIREVGMDKTVEKMYAGTESCLYKDYDERGVLISGGEAQKLAIAKALYKNAPLFIMDEPSAALDPVSEAELYEKVNTLMKDKTILFISHRLSSCCFCDRILVWKNGRIIEDGSHEELLGRGREYRELWDAQAMYYQMED